MASEETIRRESVREPPLDSAGVRVHSNSHGDRVVVTRLEELEQQAVTRGSCHPVVHPAVPNADIPAVKAKQKNRAMPKATFRPGQEPRQGQGSS